MDRKILDKRWQTFIEDIAEMDAKFNQVTIQIQQTLGKLKTAVNPHNLPYGYGNKK